MRTVGRFVWEAFAADNVAPAQEAFDLIYSLTASEQRRYELGIESPRVLGVPELLGIEPHRDSHGLLHISRRLHEQAQAVRGGDRGVLVFPTRARG